MNDDATPEERIARWVERDAALGRVAQVDELRARLRVAEDDVRQLHQRVATLSNKVVQVTVERDLLQRQIVPAPEPPPTPLAKRAVKKALRVGGSLWREVAAR